MQLPTDLREFLKRYSLLVFLVRFSRRVLQVPIRLFRGILSAFYELFSKRYQLITRNEATYFGDFVATTHYVQFLHDPKFMRSYEKAFEGIPKHVKNPIWDLDIKWRVHICTWAATKALKLEGDFVECGVWYGILSKAMCEYVEFDKVNRNFYLFDTWGKMPGSHPHENYQADIYEDVKNRFSKYKNVRLSRGLVPAVFDTVKIEKIAYLGIDMNGSIAERATPERFYEKVVPGGVIYFDDYGWGYPGLVKTVDEFFKDKPETLLHFPSGNSIVVKL